MDKQVCMLALGDIILGDGSEKYVETIKDVFLSADIRLGQLEVPYSDRADNLTGLFRETTRLEPLKGVLDLVTLAGNHIYDAKEAGVEDTVDWLDRNGILHAGAGRTLEEARKPAVIEKDGVRYGFLSYNCTGPSATWASDTKPGAAYVKIITEYDLGDVANPGGPPEHIRTYAEESSLEMMLDDIRALREKCDILTVYLHKGIVHKPVRLADYERAVSYAAIDAGADLILSSHSHILHGIEIYKGKTIYHGLCNGIAWVPSLRPDYKFSKDLKTNEIFNPKKWAEERVERFGFVPDPEYPTYPFHPEAIYTVIAKIIIENGKITETGCIPCIVDKGGFTNIVGRENGGSKVMDYLTMITDKAGLNAQYTWRGDEIIIGQK